MRIAYDSVFWRPQFVTLSPPAPCLAFMPSRSLPRRSRWPPPPQRARAIKPVLRAQREGLMRTWRLQTTMSPLPLARLILGLSASRLICTGSRSGFTLYCKGRWERGSGEARAAWAWVRGRHLVVSYERTRPHMNYVNTSK